MNSIIGIVLGRYTQVALSMSRFSFATRANKCQQRERRQRQPRPAPKRSHRPKLLVQNAKDHARRQRANANRQIVPAEGEPLELRTGKLRHQICDDQSCFMPVDRPWSVETTGRAP